MRGTLKAFGSAGTRVPPDPFRVESQFGSSTRGVASAAARQALAPGYPALALRADRGFTGRGATHLARATLPLRNTLNLRLGKIDQQEQPLCLKGFVP